MRTNSKGSAVLCVAAAIAGLAGCASAPERPTLTAEQCVVTNWGAQGYADGLAGHGHDWMQRHVAACAESGVTPDAEAYNARMVEGQRAYCTPQAGFLLAARGRSYTNGWCASDLEPPFLAAYADGVIVQEAYRRTTTADARLAEVRRQIDQIGYDATAAETRLGVEGISQEESDALRLRLRGLREQRETAQQSIRDLEWAVDESRRAYAETRSRFIPTYGAF